MMTIIKKQNPKGLREAIRQLRLRNWLSVALWNPGQCQECSKVFDFKTWNQRKHHHEWECPECGSLHHLDWKDIGFHPAADLFPMIEGKDFDDLVADIKANGLQEPITLCNDKILDGRNRYRACIEAGISADFKPKWGNQSPVDYVLSLNLHRRHLDESQRAMVAARIATMKREDTLKQNQSDASNEATTQTKAAEMLNVSRSNVQRARQVIESVDQEIISAVDAGKIAVSKAAKQVREKSTPNPETAIQDTRSCVGMMHAENAIRQLDKISLMDAQYRAALEAVEKWIQENRLISNRRTAR
jgi:hypothetical protein